MVSSKVIPEEEAKVTMDCNKTTYSKNIRRVKQLESTTEILQKQDLDQNLLLVYSPSSKYKQEYYNNMDLSLSQPQLLGTINFKSFLKY